MQTLGQQNSKIYKIYVNDDFILFFEMFKRFQRVCSKIAWNKQKKTMIKYKLIDNIKNNEFVYIFIYCHYSHF